MALLVLPTSVFLQAQIDALRNLAPRETILTDVDAARSEDIEVLVAFRLAPGIAARFPRLRFIASAGAGVDEILACGDVPENVPVTRARDPLQSARMAQYVALAVLRWHRDSDRYDAQQREGRWLRHVPEPETAWPIGLMGYGSQGEAVGLALRTLGYPLRIWTRTARVEPGVVAYSGIERLHAFLAGTRVLVCALPLTRETRGLLGDEALSVLPRGAHVVNVSRGGIVDENALLDAVARGHLAGAALDVFGREPLPSDHALWAERRIRVTPHIAATPDAETAARQILDNLARARRGEPLRNAVDRERGY